MGNQMEINMVMNPSLGVQVHASAGEFLSLHVSPLMPSTLHIAFSTWLNSQSDTPTRRYL
jgi:hypothetical protein